MWRFKVDKNYKDGYIELEGGGFVFRIRENDTDDGYQLTAISTRTSKKLVFNHDTLEDAMDAARRQIT